MVNHPSWTNLKFESRMRGDIMKKIANPFKWLVNLIKKLMTSTIVININVKVINIINNHKD